MKSTGVIVNIVKDRGFGYVRGDGEYFDRFFHKNDLPRGVHFDDLFPGDRIEYHPYEIEGPGCRARAGVVRPLPNLVNA